MSTLSDSTRLSHAILDQLGGILLGEGALAPALGADNRILDPVIQSS